VDLNGDIQNAAFRARTCSGNKLFEVHDRFRDIGIRQHLIQEVTFFPRIDDKGFVDRSELGDKQVKHIPQSLKGIVGGRNRNLQVVALGHSTSRKSQCRMDVSDKIPSVSRESSSEFFLL